jgi:MFS family permease
MYKQQYCPAMQSRPGSDLKTSWSMPFITFAASLGTMIDWYDFYIFGSLSVILSTKFFPPGDPVIAFLSTLAVFATGFAVRPFGAVVFGRIGDLMGRKYTFMLTIMIMGFGTTAIGLLPTFAQVGFVAPLILVLLRLLQGLALGGEYGGAAIYVAEHSPDNKRGYWTSYIQTTATVGLFISLMVILGTRTYLGNTVFADWGWRIPFLVSIFLVLTSLYIRWTLQETPLFSKLKAMGKTSTSPTRDSLGSKKNWKMILLALFGATAGQGVVWYTGQFYALFFLQTVLKVDLNLSSIIVGIALALATPFFIFFGWLSDRVGRKPILLAGNLLAVITYYPIYLAMHAFSSPPNTPILVALVWIQVIYVTMVYGPIAAFLVEFFPAKIRYTSLSVPYHLGNGEFGGFLPLIASAIVVGTGNIYAGLAYPISVSIITLVVGGLFLKESRHIKIWDEVAVQPAIPITAKVISKILVPVDGSAHSDKALDYAIFLAKSCGASLGVIHVSSPPPIPTSDSERDSYFKMRETDADAVLAKAESSAKTAGLQIVKIKELGHPPTRILEVASGHDLIIIGSRGMSGIKASLLGSVSHTVSQQAKCPVLIVH